jgi:hypothetical protein
MDGSIADDSMFTRTRESGEKWLLDRMRETGYVPVLGMGPFFATEYVAEKKYYTFVLTMYGVFVGERKSWKIEGMDVESGQFHPRPSPRSKSKQS